MQSLAKRHDDRAARKAANRSEFQGDAGNSLNAAVIAAQRAADALAGLTDNQRERFDVAMGDYEGVSARSLAEAPDGSGDTMAGIGVINTKVVPSAVLAAAEEGNGGGGGFKKDAGWGDTAPVTSEPLAVVEAPEGNLNGQALKDQGAGADDAEGSEGDNGGASS